MKLYCVKHSRALLSVAVLICAALLLSVTVRAQEGGVDLGGGARIFRPRNPETTSKRRAGGTGRPTTGPRRPARSNAARGNDAAAAAELEERVEDALDEGNELRDARKYSEAEASYRSVTQMKARDWRGYYGLGNIFTDQQRWEEAESAYKKAVEFNQLSADAYLALSFVLIQNRPGGNNAKRLSDSEAAARRAIQLQKDYAVAYDRLGEALVARAVLTSDTEQAYRRSLELDSQSAVTYVHMARFMRKTNRGAEATANFARALELAKDAPTFVLIADAMQSEQMYNESEPVLRRALEMDARNPSANFLMGKLLVVKREYAQAEPFLKLTIEVSPRSFAPYYVLGSTYLRMDRPTDAEQVVTRAVDVASANDRKVLAGAYGFGGIGDAYMKAGRAGDAVRVYQRALALDPSNTELQGKLAAARARVG
jgi:tetratricopeptide (TPR) repeat protein